MAESDAASAVERRDDRVDDCPLCLEPLPPFWDEYNIVQFRCCGKAICAKCVGDRHAFLENAAASGNWGREEEQLDKCCPFCRSESVDCARSAVEKYEMGQLPLDKYMDLGRCYILGKMGVEQNVERGIEILMLGAEEGDPNCQYEVGLRHAHGEDGLAQSPVDAKRWFLAAAEQGHAIAEFGLATLMRDEGNSTEYLRYLRGSSSKGYDDACYNLGLEYYHGKYGLQRSPEEAICVLTPAAERGHAKSMGLLGAVMCRPDPHADQLIDPDSPGFAKGMHLIRQAVKKGNQGAISQLKLLEKWYSSVCFLCNKWAPPEKAFLRCSRCRAAWYCSKDCQVQHWRAEEGGHKQCCIKWE